MYRIDYNIYGFTAAAINLTSQSYANLTLIITPDEEPVSGENSFDVTITSRTERVYTRTFVLVIEEQS